jgi:signal peptidase I
MDSQSGMPSALPQERRHSTLIAATTSAVIPGSGQWILGQKKLASVFLMLFLLLLALHWPIRLAAKNYSDFLLLALLGWIITVLSSCLALTIRTSPNKPVSKWWLLAFIPFSFLLASATFQICLHASGLRPFSIPSSSMSPTLVPGDSLIADMQRFKNHAPTRGEAILFSHGTDLVLVKRVIAIGGDSIAGKDGNIFVNGKLLNEPYAHHQTEVPVDFEQNNFGPILVPADQLFVMGDNRDLSLDSRMAEFTPPVRVSDVVGAPLYIYKSKTDRTGHDVQ